MASKRLFDRIDSIQLRGVTKKYDDRFAINDVSIDIEGGELVIFIGPSGSGKTTTLRMINRLIEPDSGTILINDQNIMELEPVALRRNIGYVIQSIGLFPHMTIAENIGLVAKLEGWNEKKIKDRVEYLLDFVSLPSDMFMDRYPHQLSGGQQQRVGLARALVMDPPLLLMDEPFGALDPILRKQLQEEFYQIREKLGKTIIFVTHDIEEAFKLGDRIAIMDDAKLVQIGTAEELIFHPANEMVASIVDTSKKFKHLDTLKIKDLISPLECMYVHDGSLDIESAISSMIGKNIEIAVVSNGSFPLGIVKLIDLLRMDDKESKIIDHVVKIPSFSRNKLLSSSLKIMQKDGHSMAFVMTDGKLSGFLFPNDAFSQVIG
ncbi:ABC transporter ATP-binding protein [Methanococcoides seepicolus]|uniref:Molybdate/tungstate import ATP-binding protein WtpC n=1 Tax=Methanococcoides seepicolus TaxID=2828780 RepID=A0A9E4ZGR0_9EURY|nr:betaine/proline/choline family ABC transporter ATP-binding protein [Methanococcoides seepicolus]MCM1987600.1 betaine/proline/choline family ABC transporter ATP-binding protein [Methanococcoides seepicolus]